MKHLLPLLLLFLTLPLHVQATSNHSLDSLLQLLSTLEGEAKLELYGYIYDTADYGIDPDRRLHFLQEYLREAQKQKALNDELTIRAAVLNLYYNYNQYEEFMKAFPDHAQALAQNGQEELMLTMWAFKMQLYLLSEQYDEALKEAEAMRKEMKEKDDPYMLGVAISQIGAIYHLQSHHQRAIPLLIESIDLMEQKMPYDPITLFEIYKYLTESLLKVQNTDQALYYNTRYEALLQKEEKEALQEGEDVENDIRLIVLRFYCHLLYAQAWLDKAEPDKAESYLTLCQRRLPKVSEAMKGEYHYTKSLLLDYKGEYSAAAIEIQSLIDIMEAGNLSITETNRPGWYKLKARYLAKAGHDKEAIQTYDSAYTQLESHNYHDFENRLNDLRTRYEVDRLQAEKIRNRNYFLFALAGCALLVLILVFIVNYQHRLRAKNRKLVKQVEERDALKDLLLKARRQQLEGSTPVPNDADSPQASLFTQLEEYLHSTRAYTNPELDRRELITALGTNQTYLYNAVKTMTDMSLQEYINTLRLKEAKRTLRDNREATILQIAIQCGFGTIQTFRRQFKDYYGITASEYRNTLT